MTSIKLRSRFGVALLTLLLVPAWRLRPGNGQVGQLGGEVKDATGGVLPGATVTLTSVERGFSRTAMTDGNGKFLFTVVPLGRYTVTVKLPSFQTADAHRQPRRGGAHDESHGDAEGRAASKSSTTVVGETPIVDATNQTLETRVRVEEFSKLAIGRNYQALMGVTPGVVGTGNVNSHGALSQQQHLHVRRRQHDRPDDGHVRREPELRGDSGSGRPHVDASASNSAAARARSWTSSRKSGTNRFEGSFKYLATNDNWNTQNTHEERSARGASLARTKFDQVNPVYSGTVGGPIAQGSRLVLLRVRGRAQHDAAAPDERGARVRRTRTTSRRRRRRSGRCASTTQLAPNHNVWVKYATSPTDGFIIDYWGNSAERRALTAQNQGGSNLAVQYNGVFGTKWTASFMARTPPTFIDVVPFETARRARGRRAVSST